ncbi:MAG TPA: group 1 truncated hemoglobin [Rhizomicrobium sp.]|jgi:hemoglobin
MKRALAFAFPALLASLLVYGAAAAADDALYGDLGQKDGIVRIVDAATANFLSDPRIKATFDNTNMDRFKGFLVDQLCVVAGGPCVYKGRTMHETHKGLHLTNRDFNALVEDLQKGMDTAGVSFRVQNRLLARLAPMQHDVVTR